MKQWILGALILGSSQAWAVNKCDGPDGGTVFQDTPCAGKGDAISVKPASGEADPSAAKAARIRLQRQQNSDTTDNTTRLDARNRSSPNKPSPYSRCPTAQEIKNMEVSANSITLDRLEKRERLRQIREARKCR